MRDSFSSFFFLSLSFFLDYLLKNKYQLFSVQLDVDDIERFVYPVYGSKSSVKERKGKSIYFKIHVASS